MSVQRQGNYLSQERLEVFDFRSLESSICYDFDTGFGSIQAGQQPLVVTGLTISVTGTAGNPVSNLILNTAGAVILHPLATESGTIFRVPGTQAAEQLSATNPVVIGSFSSGTSNYVGLDLIRESDTTTADLTKFLDANTKKEVSLTVPKVRGLVYRIVLSQQPFSTSSNLLPIAIVVTDGSNNVSSITDARQMFFRLGTGGDIPNAQAPYTWPDASRTENPITYGPPTSSLDPFVGGDKGITNMKSLLAAIQSSIWELRGGKSWYSPNNRDNVQLLYTSSVLSSGPGTGDNFGFSGSTLVWKGLELAFENSAVSYNIIQDNASTGVTILDQQCLYVDIQRDTVATVVPGVAYLTALGTPVIPGTRFIIAWREGSDVFTRNRAYQVNRVIPVASAVNLGIVQLHQASMTPLVPIVFSDGDKDTATGIVGLNSNKQAAITSTTGDALTAAAGANSDTGVSGFGGPTAGYGVYGQGGSGGTGIYGQGTSTGNGVYGKGGTTGGIGIVGLGGIGGAGIGVMGTGDATGVGVMGQGSPAGSVGVSGTGTGTNVGLQASKGTSALAAIGSNGPIVMTTSDPSNIINSGGPCGTLYNGSSIVHNTIYPVSTVKAWGVISISLGSAVLAAGYNVSSISIIGSGSTTAIQVNYLIPMTSSTAHHFTANNEVLDADVKGTGVGSTTHALILGRNPTTGAQVNILTAGGGGIDHIYFTTLGPT